MASPTVVAKQFVDFYYMQFDTNRTQLAPLYRPGSMLSFESSEFLGAESILEKLTGLPFAQVRHEVTTLDAQPSQPTGALLVLVTGKLLVDDNTQPISFSQAFQLIPEGSTYYVHNDVFRLVYG